MELKNLSKEEIREYSFIEIAHYLLIDKHEPMSFQDMLEEWKTMLGLTDKEVKEHMVQFYTDLNMDGNFIFLKDNRWGLRTWYPLDQVEDEQVTSEIKAKKKKKSKKVVEDDLDFDDIDEDEDELEFDDLTEIDEIDADLDEEDEDEEDFDEDLIEDEDFDLDEEDEEEDELDEEDEEDSR